jgi:Co/Zn/Cd efflux system component
MSGAAEEEQQRRNVLKRLKVAASLCLCFMIVEVIGGYLAGSLAIMSDAAHLFADLASFAVASKCIIMGIFVCMYYALWGIHLMDTL